MFRRILILLLFLLSSFCLSAQKPFEPTTHIGIHGGVNFNTVNFRPAQKGDFLPGQAYGILFRHVSEPNIGTQLEINFSAKGWKEVIDSVGTYTRKIQTINFPLLAAFIAGSKKLRFAFTLGPYVDYRLSDKEEINIPDPSKFRTHYLKPLANKWEFGFTGGISIEYYTKIGGFAVRANYSHALSNIYPLNKGTYYFSASRMMVINGGIGYFVSF
jgi:hypothetical protein